MIVRSEGCVEDPAISSISTITINSGSPSIFICDNNQIIVLNEGLNNFFYKKWKRIDFRSKMKGCVASTSNHFSIERYGLWQWLRGQWKKFINEFLKKITESSETKFFSHFSRTWDFKLRFKWSQSKKEKKLLINKSL
jgi:hypothetical protein